MNELEIERPTLGKQEVYEYQWLHKDQRGLYTLSDWWSVEAPNDRVKWEKFYPSRKLKEIYE